MQEMIVDTAKMRENGKDIINLCSELNEQINYLFDRISKMKETDCWTGPSADKFIVNTLADKAQYIAFKNALQQQGVFLVQHAESFESEINSLKR